MPNRTTKYIRRVLNDTDLSQHMILDVYDNILAYIQADENATRDSVARGDRGMEERRRDMGREQDSLGAESTLASIDFSYMRHVARRPS